MLWRSDERALLRRFGVRIEPRNFDVLFWGSGRATERNCGRGRASVCLSVPAYAGFCFHVGRFYHIPA